MNKIKLVAILRGIQPAEAADHIETLINAGFRYIEIPLNSPDWQQSIPPGQEDAARLLPVRHYLGLADGSPRRET